MVEPTTPPRRWLDRPLIRVLVVGCWLAAAALAVLFVARLSGRDLNRTLTLVLSFLPVIALGAFPLLVLAAAFQRKALAGVCAALLLVALVLYVPARGPGARAAPEGWPTIRVLSANLLFHNTEVDRFLAEIPAIDPDVIVLQEVTDGHRTAITESGLRATYPHELDGAEAVDPMILSKFPLSDETITNVHGRRMPQATVATPGGPVQLIDVHTVPPVYDLPGWTGQLDELSDIAQGLGRPLLVGDFNATLDHAPFRRLLDEADLTDGQLIAGSGWGTTWREGNHLPPLLRIDHVLTGAGLEVVSLTTGVTPGSDHRHLVADIAVDPSD